MFGIEMVHVCNLCGFETSNSQSFHWHLKEKHMDVPEVRRDVEERERKLAEYRRQREQEKQSKP